LGSPDKWGFPAGIQLIPGNKHGEKRRMRMRAFGHREKGRNRKGMFFFSGKGNLSEVKVLGKWVEVDWWLMLLGLVIVH
jgi:hypothetical protein